ncbi:hypothetical protein [Demequina sp. NBRC 110053]|uniref:hypothetical protein n=1 Tax=Demequina sp. NBRC 110053 TaxID=1570342 RepID=UPI0011847293|nr:hypothetical protein [Demequina sp. NBRC 110053]
MFRPRLALGLWLACLLAGAGMLSAALGIVVADAATLTAAGTAGGDWVSTVAAWCGLAVLGCLAAAVGAAAASASADARPYDDALTRLAASPESRVVRDGVEVLVIAGTPGLTALVDPAGRGRVLVGSEFARALGSAGFEAAVAHEVAHVRGRHTLLLRAARLTAVAFSRVPRGLHFEQAVRTLVELIADDAAVRRCGRDAVREALAVQARFAPGCSAELRAQRLYSPFYVL